MKPAEDNLTLQPLCADEQCSILTGAGANVLLSTLFQRANERLMSGLPLMLRRASSLAPRLAGENLFKIPPLLRPTLRLDKFLLHLAAELSVAEVLGLAHRLARLFLEHGVPQCTSCGRPMFLATPAAVLDQLFAGSRQSAQLTKPCYLTALFPAAAIKSKAKKGNKLIEEFRLLGYRRFFIGERLVTFPLTDKTSLHENETTAADLNIGENGAALAVVVDRLTLAPENRERIQEGLEMALSLGAPFSELRFISTEETGARSEERKVPLVACAGYACLECLNVQAVPRYNELAQTLVPQILNKVNPENKRSKFQAETSSSFIKNLALSGKTLSEVLAFSAAELQAWLGSVVDEKGQEHNWAKEEPWCSVLTSLSALNLEQLCLLQPLSSLADGERVKLALAYFNSQKPVGLLFLLGDLTGRFHKQDQLLILAALKQLADAGNACIAVSHEESFLQSASVVYECGPHGTVTLRNYPMGQARSAKQTKSSEEAQHLQPPLHTSAKELSATFISPHGLKTSLSVPLHSLVVVSGPSGTGKSCLLRQLEQALNNQKKRDKGNLVINGARSLKGAYLLKASQLRQETRWGWTIAAVVRLEQELAELFAALPAARRGGFTVEDFSLSKKGGRCELCRGRGVVVHDLDFASAVFDSCPRCLGLRYQSKVLQVSYNNLTIADVYQLSVHQALSVFTASRGIVNTLALLENFTFAEKKLGDNIESLEDAQLERLHSVRLLVNGRLNDRLVLLDRPFAGLGEMELEGVLSAFRSLLNKGASLLIGAEQSKAQCLADKVLVLEL